jgi:hypothetical protein
MNLVDGGIDSFGPTIPISPAEIIPPVEVVFGDRLQLVRNVYGEPAASLGELKMFAAPAGFRLMLPLVGRLGR